MLRASITVVALAVVLPTLVHADPILKTTALGVSYSELEGVPTPTCYVEGTTTANCNRIVEHTPYATGYGVDYSNQRVEAEAGAGYLYGAVSEHGYPDGEGPFSSIYGYYLVATAEVTDTMTITGGTGTGYLQYLFSGSISSLSSNFADPDYNSSFKFRHDGGDLIEVVNGAPAWQEIYGPVSGELELDWENQWPYLFSYASAPMPFTYGVPFELYMYGRAMTEIAGDCCGNGSLDVTFDGFRVAPTAVPEPTSLLLMGTGLAAAAWRRKRLVPADQPSRVQQT